MSYLRQVIELSVDNGAPLYRYDALCRLGMNQLDSGDVAAARRSMEEAQRTTNAKPDVADTDCPLLVAFLDDEENRGDKAIAQFQSVSRVNRESGDLTSSQQYDWSACRVLYDTGRFEELLACCDRYDARLIQDEAPIPLGSPS